MPDELLSSWLVRIAVGHGMTVQQFAIAALGGPIWSRDIDTQASAGLLARIASGCGVSLERAVEATLKANASGSRLTTSSDALMPLYGGPRKRRWYGLQCCPRCLRQPSAYVRRSWRLAFTTVCSIHCVELIDRCRYCSSPIYICQRPPKEFDLPFILARCARCAMPLVDSPTADDRLVRLQELLAVSMSNPDLSLLAVVTEAWNGNYAKCRRQRKRGLSYHLPHRERIALMRSLLR